MEVCEEAPQGGAPPSSAPSVCSALGAGPLFPGAATRAGEKKRAAHLEPVRGLFLQGFLKVKISSDFSCSL